MTFSIVQIVAVLIFGTSSFLAGWMLRRIQSKTREAQLQRNLGEAKGAIGPLETHIRNRDQRIATLIGEATDWKTKLPTLEASIKRKDVEALAKERELKVARAQLDALKAATAAPDPELASLRDALRAAEERSATLAAAVAERDLRLARPDGSPAASFERSIGDGVPAIQAFEMEIAARDRSIAQLQSRLDAEIELRRGQDANLASRDSELERANAEATKWRLRVPKLVATIKAHDATLAAHAALLAERDATIAARDAQAAAHVSTIAARDATIADGGARIAARDTALAQGDAALTQEVQKAAQLFVELEQQRATNAGLNTALTLRMAEIANLSSQLGAGAVQHEAISAALEERVREVASVTQRNAVLAGEAERQAANLSSTLKLGREELDAQNIDLARAKDERTALEQRLVAMGSELTTLQTRGAAIESERATLEQRVALTDTLVDSIREERASLEQHNAVLQTEQSALHARFAAADALRVAGEQQLALLQREHIDAKRAADALQHALELERGGKAQVAEETAQRLAELAQMHAEVRGLHTRIAPLESLLKQRDAALSERAKRIEVLSTQVQALTTQNEAVQSTLRTRGERIAELERNLSKQPLVPAPIPADPADEDLVQLLAEQVEKNHELSALVDERDHELGQAVKNTELNTKSLLVLKQQLDGARAAEERLAGQVRELKAAVQSASTVAPAATKPTTSKPQGLFDAPPARIDELQQIHGIGAGFERGLNKLGIYHFGQLAGLSAEEIVWIEANLPTFHGRVERDDWPGQAAVLMASSEHAEWSLRAQVDGASLAPRIN